MGFPMIPKLCSGVIPFQNYKMIKTTYMYMYRCDCCRNTFRENGLWKKCWTCSASCRRVTSVFTITIYMMFYTNIFMYFWIIKLWNHTMKLRITNMNMYYIQRCHTRTYVCQDSHCWYVLCTDVDVRALCMWNTHGQTGCLACVPAPSIRVYKHTTQSSYGPSVLH